MVDTSPFEDSFVHQAGSSVSPGLKTYFDRLPLNVIEHILYASDANTFASLSLLNRRWKHASDSAALYAYQLSRCSSFSWARGVISEAENLTKLKRQFVKQVRQNAFDAFLRPRQTLLRLISSSMSSSMAFPQGEVFRFSFSGNGQMVLCISSSRIVILDVATDPVAVKHELITRRRPLRAAIRDDGSLIAVLSSTHRVHIYKLSDDEAKHIRVITLDDAPRYIKFSPSGSVLALAFEDSIEVYAVAEEALSTDRRAVRCHRVDALSFSPDGSMLLGFTAEGIVTITPPFYTETGTDASPEELEMRMWTTQILFPETISCPITHVSLIAGYEEADDHWVMGYDKHLGAFRAIQLNKNAGIVYFASPFLADESREMQPSMRPATDETGELSALGFQDSELWIYGMPGLGASGITDTQVGGDHHYGGCAPRDNLAQLQKIVQQPKILIRGRRVSDMHGITSAHWVRSDSKCRRRLVAVAPGGVRPQNLGREDIPVDGGRILLLDFERSTMNGETTELDIEVGETAPKILMEPDSSLATEVELERRRTRLHRGDTATRFADLGHSATTRESRALPLHFRRNSLAIPTSPSETSPGDIIDLPYDNTQPRSSEVLHRAATVAASTRGRYDPRYRNSHAPRQIPHESDADNWVPPPPPYTADPLPDGLPRTPLSPVNVVDSVPQPEREATARVAQHPTRPRPQSVNLQGLGGMTGARRRGSSIGRDFNPDQLIPQDSFTNNFAPQQPGSALNPPTVIQPTTPTFAVYPSEPLLQESNMPLPYLRSSALGDALGDAYFPYSVSSPNLLHIPQPYEDGQGTAADDEHDVPERQRSFHRRVSTEPSSLPPPTNEEWRRRIQDWNDNTIKERSRKRRGKCTVM
ncbi:hypothetical protein DTO013E5_1418 [Penicillium roqueforti]|uniref:F-box domain, cyclin-like n=1 Tax=Penicillium roqueforti (strain FM164) TaxID=1365484 RepID=W6QAZ3_PENRF|nr:hypothetical protein CBS147372_2366 [Penicillium roqueforti]CDM33635.1 F-box domain, cyclin-like [Penicillium roqueforti FM164]KAI2745306.1 hypothetical protein DTO012A1_1945 [Penicillium roqueforti]KAI2754135.1 hypothetical protein DTO013F2_1961 [Penicillium roqueforti]KAI2766774.1 hypothetical protein DTO012A8_8019 [Penicillium roqueforti]